jgi:hypothetical protein
MYCDLPTGLSIRGSKPDTRKKFLLSPKHPDLFRRYGGYIPGVKRPGREVRLSLLSSVKVKNGWSCSFTPHAHFHVLGRVILPLILSVTVS